MPTHDLNPNVDPSASAVQAVADLAPVPEILVAVPDRLAYLVTPKDVVAEPVDLESLRPRPSRRRGTVHPATVGALIDYTKRHYHEDETTLWVDVERRQVVAVIDDHDGKAADPAWRQHRASLLLKTTPEWDMWIANNEKSLQQIAFGEHIEDGYAELVNPDAATMLELAQNLEGSAGGSFKSRQRLRDGSMKVQFDHDVTISGGGTGELELPEKLELLLSPLVGEDKVAMTARLRVRVNSGHLTLMYILDRPDEVIRDACDLIVARLSESFAHVYLGRPE